jgi:hypothetical protein
MRIQVTKMMRNLANPNPQHFWFIIFITSFCLPIALHLEHKVQVLLSVLLLEEGAEEGRAVRGEEQLVQGVGPVARLQRAGQRAPATLTQETAAEHLILFQAHHSGASSFRVLIVFFVCGNDLREVLRLPETQAQGCFFFFTEKEKVPPEEGIK